MRGLIIAPSPASVVAPANAISRYQSAGMTCAEIQSPIQNEGAVILGYPADSVSSMMRFDRYVRSSHDILPQHQIRAARCRASASKTVRAAFADVRADPRPMVGAGLSFLARRHPPERAGRPYRDHADHARPAARQDGGARLHRAPADRRTWLLYLAPQAHPLLEIMRSNGQKTRDEAFVGLSADTQLHLLQTLSLIKSNLLEACGVR
jgi:hypothetical protein